MSPLFSRSHAKRDETGRRTVMALVNDIDRRCLSSLCKRGRREEIFLNVQRPHTFVSVSRFSSTFFFLLSSPRRRRRRRERLERKLKRLRGKMAPRDGNCYLHPLILSKSGRPTYRKGSPTLNRDNLLAKKPIFFFKTRIREKRVSNIVDATLQPICEVSVASLASRRGIARGYGQ